MTNSGESSGELLRWALAALGDGPSSARLEAELLLAHTLSKPRTRLIAWPEDPVSTEQADRYRALIARRVDGEPVAYLTGRREFWSLSLEVTPDTLIPRPETEHLVEVALAMIPDDEAMAVADLGTGSGAVAAAIASERPHCLVTATDACPRALAVAEGNLARLGLDNVTLRQGNWCEALAEQRFAVIVSNPPYVASGDQHLSRGDVRFEPRLALSAGQDGLDAIRTITGNAIPHLLPGATLLVEHGHDQGAAVQDLFHQHGYREVRGFKDLAGIDRVVGGGNLGT